MRIWAAVALALMVDLVGVLVSTWPGGAPPREPPCPAITSPTSPSPALTPASAIDSAPAGSRRPALDSRNSLAAQPGASAIGPGTNPGISPAGAAPVRPASSARRPAPLHRQPRSPATARR